MPINIGQDETAQHEEDVDRGVAHAHDSARHRTHVLPPSRLNVVYDDPERGKPTDCGERANFGTHRADVSELPSSQQASRDDAPGRRWAGALTSRRG